MRPISTRTRSKKKAEQDSTANVLKNVMDSVAQATKLQVEQQRAAEEVAQLQVKRNKEHTDSLYERLIQVRSQLESAQMKLNDSKQFQFLRTSDEKYSQVQKSKADVDHLQLEILRIENELRGQEHVSAIERASTEKAVLDSIAQARQASGH